MDYRIKYKYMQQTEVRKRLGTYIEKWKRKDCRE